MRISNQTPSEPMNLLPPDSAKVDRIKNKQAEQLHLFETWARAGQWQNIHNAHYDWWMFPVNRPSAGYGETYSVGKGEIQALKTDAAFMDNYRRGVVLVVNAWGWDLDQDQPVKPSSDAQCWTGYGVRLAKMSDSLQLFDEKKLHQKLKRFFNDFCLPQQRNIPISDLPWLNQSFNP